MSFDLDSLAGKIARHGRVARVVVADCAGSTPREVGASMLVWDCGQEGTIGGGALEFNAAISARDCGSDQLDRHALGPSLGQCCGGNVTILTEIWDADRIASLNGETVVRPLPGETRPLSLAAQRILSKARNSGAPVIPSIVDGWMIEPILRPTRHLWIYGAGHVGRAIVNVVSDLPDIEITWVDTSDDRFPKPIPESVTKLVAQDPASVVQYAPPEAEHLVLTYSHALDLELCHRILAHGFSQAGLIGSATKWARFRKRLGALGHATAQIDRIQCPIGDPSLGKQPQAIAVGVATALLKAPAIERSAKDAG